MAPDKDLQAQLSSLERKYVQLLERRVAELEGRSVSSVSPDLKSQIKASTDDTETEKNANDKKSPTKAPEDDDSKESAEGDGDEKTRYRVVLNQLNPETGEYEDKPSIITPKSQTDNSEKTRAFTFRKFLKDQTVRGDTVMKAKGSEIDIDFQPLQSLVGEITFKFWGSKKVTTMGSPYSALIHCWTKAEEEAEKYANDSDPTKKQTGEDLKEILRLLSSGSGDETLDRYFKSRDKLKEGEMITFDCLWVLFPKGTEILAKPFLNEHQIFFIQSVTMPDLDDAEPVFSVVAYSYDWDGSRFNRVPYSMEIPYFQDMKKISELTFYPLKYHVDTEPNGRNGTKSLRERLIARGKRYFEYCTATQGKQTFQYDGYAYYHRNSGLFRSSDKVDDESDSFTTDIYSSKESANGNSPSKSHIKGVVVVDFKSYFQYQSPSAATLGDLSRGVQLECSCSECKKKYEEIYRYSWDKREPKKELFKDEHYMLFPPRVLGYSLDQKQWVQVQVNSLRSPGKANQVNFHEKLQLKQEYKDIISKSVIAHGENNIMDHIPGKGKGLVILLWGVPGVGKTLTAESVASLAGKPLFSVGVSDIGLEGSKVETNLQKVFDLAGLWKAVLLFDEADVFLEARDTHRADIQRNTIVSVLLRSLEYYDGILILTTNRLKSFDLAVQSRIHIAVEYNDLNQDQKQQIFMEFLNQLKVKDLIDPTKWDSIQTWVEEEGRSKAFNGRQIRNIVSTAMGLAHADGRKLERKYLSLVAMNTSAFKDALAAQEAVYRNNQIRTYNN
ncbi:uncharacterized protein F4807DRAFT_314289 [Annulohypoxylon truncatum]|uniref:uncharacterized protein n=1 Tax=Annulohypoxylon truncatum TaxID=327061 RepID=UPI002008AFEA|nr:uncharacterized protein F4807DRAFT_314289 [Annulohypoxylon truncatum]KAI1204853.1 hypothetical protein F4807DRAFT_314289 [Annulohypoxylon truncatum]